MTALVFTSCQDLLMVEDTLEAQQEALEVSEATKLSQLTFEQTEGVNGGGYFPELSFRKNKKGEVRLQVKDRTICQLSSACQSSDCSISVLPKECRPNGRITLKSAACADCPSETVILVFDKIEMSTYSIQLPAGSPTFSEEVVSVNVVYSGLPDAKETTYNYHVFVFADGTTALQSPNFGGFQGGIRIEAADINGDGINEASVGTITVINDPAFEVAAVKVTFNEPFGGPVPLNTSYIADCGTCQSGRTFQDRSYVFDAQFAPGQNPTGSTYNITTTMLNAKGEVIGQSITTENVVQRADFTGRIRRVRVRQEGDGSNEYRIIGTVEGDSKREVVFVDVKFMDAADFPMAIPTHAVATLKRINEENGRARYEFSPLTFVGDAQPIGKTYTVQATMLDANSKPLANTVTMEVTVEGTRDEEPSIVSSTLTSNDNGLTWDITVTLEDKGQWVEKVVYEFVKPYDGPAPLVNPITLVRLGEAPGNVEVYTATGIKFEQNPAGFTYTALINQFGSGTRRSTGQASNKAALL